MSIAQMQKITIAGAASDLPDIVTALQQFGRAHVIDKHSGALIDEEALFPEDKHADEAIRYLANCSQLRRSVSKATNFHFDTVVEQALKLKAQQRQFEEELDEINERVKLVRPWGDFTFPPESYVEKFRLWFYWLPVNQRHALNTIELPWQIVGRSNRFWHVVVISPTEPPADLLPVARQRLGSRSLNELLERQEKLETQLEDLYAKRQALSRFLFLMRKHRAQARNQAYFNYVMEQAENQQEFFTLNTWLPRADLTALQALGEQHQFATVACEPAATEQPPTLLEPAKPFKPGAILASIYQMPSYRGWDPSAHLYLSFSLFFAMIMSDAGYALVLSGGLLLGWRSMGKTEFGAALRDLLRFMLATAGLWGVLCGSFFGVSPPVESWLGQLKIIDLENYDAMMRISIFAGVLHIVLANLTSAWSQHRNGPYALMRSGWSLIALSGYAWWQLPASHHLFAQSGIGCGALLVLLFSASAKQHEQLSIGRRLLGGLTALTEISKLFGDVLSYMRLFALGLASASLALTFNSLAVTVMSEPGIGWISGTLILIIGHVINLALAIMSGLVHGLRLNFIEFYNWAEPGEGYAYTPFSLQEIDHD